MNMLAGLFRLIKGVLGAAAILVGLVLLLIAVSPPNKPSLSAQPVRFIPPDMTCKAARAVLDAEPPSKGQIRAVAEGIDQIFVALDEERAATGRARVYARMSEDGRHTAMALTAARCADHPQEALRRAAVVTYAGLAALGGTAGVND
jgi:hypothetical protein